MATDSELAEWDAQDREQQICCLSYRGEPVPGQPDLIEAECVGVDQLGRRLFRAVPGWYPVDGAGRPAPHKESGGIWIEGA